MVLFFCKYVGYGLPSWYELPDGQQFSCAILFYSDSEMYSINEPDISQLIDEIRFDNIGVEDRSQGKQFKLIQLNSNFYLVIFYLPDEFNDIIEFELKNHVDIISSINPVSEEFNYFLAMVDTLEEFSDLFSDTGNLIVGITSLHPNQIGNLLVDLITYYLKVSNDEIRFLYNLPDDHLHVMMKRSTIFDELVYETIDYSEIISAQLIGKLPRDKTKRIAGNIGNREFLIEFIKNQSHTVSIRFQVLLSVVEREIIEGQHSIDLLSDLREGIISSSSITMDELIKLQITILELSINNQPTDFISMVDQLNQINPLKVEDIGDMILRHGKAPFFLSYLENESQSSQGLSNSLFMYLEDTLSPGEEEEKEGDNLDLY